MSPRATGKRTTSKSSANTDPQGMFSGMVTFLTETGVQSRRLQIWRQKLMQMGGSVVDTFSKKVTRVFAMNIDSLLQEIDRGCLARSKAKVLLYQWIEDSLREGKRAPEESYILSLESGGGDKASNASEATFHNHENESHPGVGEPVTSKKSRISLEDPRHTSPQDVVKSQAYESSNTTSGPGNSFHSPSSEVTSSMTFEGQNKNAAASDSKFLYSPPDLNWNITEIFRKLIDIYRAMGDDRRSFSYYKAIPVIEKLPFKIESVDQVKNLPGIGKSLQEHIQEIVTTGKLSKLEHFERDEKVRTISLFGEIWGVGPATALKLYDKGYRTLDDLNSEESLTNSQRLGLKYFNDIRTRIQRQEVQEMERLLQTVGEDIMPGVIIVCGGSYRRGKASCGDMDIVITHPDGKRAQIQELILILVFALILVESCDIV